MRCQGRIPVAPQRGAPHLSLAICVALAFWCGVLWAAPSAASLTREGRALFAKAKYSEAASKLEAALAEDPDYIAAEACLAATYQALGDSERAVDHYWAVQRSVRPALPPGAGKAATRERERLVECEALILIRANDERRKAKLPLLIPDPLLAQVARQHSEEMRDLDYFSHESPTEGLTTIRDRFQSRVKNAAEYEIAENIARRWAEGAYSLSPECILQTHKDWMQSPGHRENILNKQLERIGVGIAVNAEGDYWATQFFATYDAGTH